MTKPHPTQLDKFKEAARQHETDDGPERFRGRMGKPVRHKPVEKVGVRLALVAALAVLPSAALAQTGPYKLIITWPQSDITVIDYPSQSRCERGRKAVEAEAARILRESLATMPHGRQVASRSPYGAFCIPG